MKVPGDSDGECNRWNPPGAIDPVRGKHDPRAGAWFPDLAVELVRNAGPTRPPDEAQLSPALPEGTGAEQTGEDPSWPHVDLPDERRWPQQ